MSLTYNATTMTPDDPRQRNISDLTEALDAVLAPLSCGRQTESLKQDLEALVLHGAHYGWQLFSQPTSWMFSWNHGDEKVELVVLPALLQTGDDQGRARAVPQAFSEAQTVSLTSQ